jgi:parvulin-like peptidyl-prolyl isomerase
MRRPDATIGRVKRWILILVMGLTACKGEDSSSPKPSAPGGSVVAVVNGVAISKEEYRSTLAHAGRTFSPQPEEKAALAQRVLEKMITDELLIQHAHAQRIQVTSEEVEQKLQEIAEAGGGEAAVEAFSEKSGLSKARMRANLERNLLIERLAGRTRASLKVTEAEVKEYYQAHLEDFRRNESVTLAHILFRESQGDPLARAKKAHAEIKGGLAFEKAVKKYSDDALTKDQGGSLGTLKRGEMLPEMEEPAFSLKKGAVSPPVKSPRGIHLLKVLERKQGSQRPLDEVREEIRSRMLDSLVESGMRELAERLRREGNVRLGGL